MRDDDMLLLNLRARDFTSRSAEGLRDRALPLARPALSPALSRKGVGAEEVLV
jgi:hypothetical protein